MYLAHLSYTGPKPLQKKMPLLLIIINNNNNMYLAHLSYTGPKPLQILFFLIIKDLKEPTEAA